MANARAAAMQTAFVGSVKLVGFFFTPNRPATTPLMEWAKAATERARLERLRHQAGTQQASIQVMGEDEAMFSRDRD